MNKVTVKAYEGQVVVPSKNNPLYGSVRVEGLRQSTSGNFMKTSKASAFINGLLTDFALQGWKDGQQIDGYIIIEESLEAPNAKDKDQGLKIAGDSGVVCSIDGESIYRTSRFSLTPAEDTLIEHDNGDEIKVAQAKLEEAKLDA